METSTNIWKIIKIPLKDVKIFLDKKNSKFSKDGLLIPLDEHKLVKKYLPKGFKLEENYIDIEEDVYLINCFKEE